MLGSSKTLFHSLIIAVLQGGYYLHFKYEETEAQRNLFEPVSSFESHALSPSFLCSSDIYFLHRTCFPPGQLEDEPVPYWHLSREYYWFLWIVCKASWSSNNSDFYRAVWMSILEQRKGEAYLSAWFYFLINNHKRENGLNLILGLNINSHHEIENFFLFRQTFVSTMKPQLPTRARIG